jgi:FkbM family methyltransferase
MRPWLSKSPSFNRLVGRLTHRQRYASVEEVESAERAFYRSHLHDGAIAFDAGACIGEITLMFSELVGGHGKVHAFEAGRGAFEQLRTNCEAAGRSNVVLNHLALSDSECDVTLNIYDREHQSWNTLAARPLAAYGIDVKTVGTETVHATTVDNYCRRHAIQLVDLLKIDVEGAEYQVLLGARQMLAEKRIRACIFEFGATTFDAGNRPKDIEGYLTSLNYRLANLVPNDPLFPGGRSAATASFSMHLATPR